jgi:uncharacterized protein with HEPN domain
MKSDEVYRGHILDAIQRIEGYLRGVDNDGFRSEPLLQDAVVRQLMVLGEASARLSDDFRRSHPDVPWRQIGGMRNRIVHDYMSIDLDVVWGVVHNDLPSLKARLGGGDEPAPVA